MLMGISAFSQCSLETLKSCSPCLSSRALYSNVDRHDIDPAFLIIKGAKEVTGSLISGHIMFNIALKHLKVWCSFEPDYNYNIAIQTKEILRNEACITHPLLLISQLTSPDIFTVSVWVQATYIDACYSDKAVLSDCSVWWCVEDTLYNKKKHSLLIVKLLLSSVLLTLSLSYKGVTTPGTQSSPDTWQINYKYEFLPPLGFSQCTPYFIAHTHLNDLFVLVPALFI